MIYTYADITKNLSISADVCVIGSGAGGAVVAKELAEAGLEVVILEEGSHFTNATFGQGIRARIRNLYKSGGAQATEGNTTIAVMQGRCVGGSTVINSGICFRPPEYLLKKWVKQENFTDLTPSNLSPLFDRVEKEIGYGISKKEVAGVNNHLMEKGAQALNWSGGYMPRNAPKCVGCGGCNFGCPVDAKQSTLVSYIPKAIKSGATLYTNCRAEKIITKGGQAVGVEGQFLEPYTDKKGLKIKVKCKYVVLAAGAIATPLILQINKLANSSQQIGKNLHLHVATGLIALFEQEVKWWNGIPQGYYVDQFLNEGLLMQSFTAPPELLSTDIHGVGMEQLEIIARFKNFMGVGAMISDTSSGTVRLDKKWKAKIEYHLNDEDFEKIKKVLQKSAELMLAAGAKTVLANLPHAPEIHQISEIQKAFDHRLTTADLSLVGNHPMGTCKMGSNPKTSVVDEHCQSHDVKNLFIADASIFPSSLGVNPQVSIMTFATYAAKYIASIAS